MTPDEWALAIELGKFVFNGLNNWMDEKGATQEQKNLLWIQVSTEMRNNDPNTLPN
jgi:hypothetical protein